MSLRSVLYALVANAVGVGFWVILRAGFHTSFAMTFLGVFVLMAPVAFVMTRRMRPAPDPSPDGPAYA